MKRSDMITDITNKIKQFQDETAKLKSRIGKVVDGQKPITQTTFNTQRQIRNEKVRFLNGMLAIAQLLQDKDYKMTKEQIEAFEAAVDTTKRAVTLIEVNKGENLMAILSRYPKSNLDQIKKAVEAKGLKINPATMIVE